MYFACKKIQVVLQLQFLEVINQKGQAREACTIYGGYLQIQGEAYKTGDRSMLDAFLPQNILKRDCGTIVVSTGFHYGAKYFIKEAL